MNLSTTKRLLVLNTAAQLVSRFVSSGSTFIIGLVLARQLGADGFGDFSKITTYIPFFYLMVDLGLNASYLRIKATSSSVNWSDLLGLRLVLACIAVFASVGITFFLPRGIDQGYTNLVRTGIYFYSLSIIAHALITSTNAYFQQTLNYTASAIALTVGSLLSLLSILLIPISVISATAVLLLGSIITCVLAMGIMLYKQSIIPSFRINKIKQLLIDTAPLSVTLLFNLLYFRIDSIILTLFRSTQEVGIYNLAYKCFEFFLVIPVFFMNSLYPVLLKRAGNQERFKMLLHKAQIVLLVLGGATTLTVWISSPLLTTINDSFSGAVPLLRLLSLSFPIFFISNLTMWTLITKRFHKPLVLVYGTAMIVNIILNTIFIPLYGAYASALITIGGELFVFTASYIYLQKYTKATS